MRCIDHVNGCSAEVVIHADNIACSEYQVSGVPGQETTLQCWLPIESGQVLTVSCDLEMTSLMYHVDLIVDGILRNVWVSTIGQKAKLRESHIEFEEGIFKHIRSLHRSSMKVARLGQRNILLHSFGIAVTDRFKFRFRSITYLPLERSRSTFPRLMEMSPTSMMHRCPMTLIHGRM